MKRFAPMGWAALGGSLVAIALYVGGFLSFGVPLAEPRAGPATADTLTLTSEQQNLTGVKVAMLKTASVVAERRGFARSIDATTLATIMADRSVALAALSASQSEEARLSGLYAADQSASRRSLEAAQAITASDRAKLALAEQRVGIELGAGLGHLGSRDLGNLVRDIASGNAILIRIDMPGSPLLAGQTVAIGNARERFAVRILGAAAQGDRKLQTPGALAILRGPAARALPIGRIVPASFSGGPIKSGLFVPSAAIVRWQGSRWVFRQKGKSFERIELTGGESVPVGWLVNADLMGGDRIAIEGAGSLLTAEQGRGSEDE